jgi:hypothetical protein
MTATQTSKIGVLDDQQSHWEEVFSNNPEMFGSVPSRAAIEATEIFKKRIAEKFSNWAAAKAGRRYK